MVFFGITDAIAQAVLSAQRLERDMANEKLKAHAFDQRMIAEESRIYGRDAIDVEVRVIEDAPQLQLESKIVE
jgi:hypothetical protein